MATRAFKQPKKQSRADALIDKAFAEVDKDASGRQGVKESKDALSNEDKKLIAKATQLQAKVVGRHQRAVQDMADQFQNDVVRYVFPKMKPKKQEEETVIDGRKDSVYEYNVAKLCLQHLAGWKDKTQRQKLDSARGIFFGVSREFDCFIDRCKENHKARREESKARNKERQQKRKVESSSSEDISDDSDVSESESDSKSSDSSDSNSSDSESSSSESSSSSSSDSD